MLQVFLKSGFGLGSVIQVVAINLGDGEKRFSAELAAGIFTAQEFQLADGILEILGIVEDPALLVQKLSHGQDRSVGFMRGGCNVVDLAIGVENALIIFTRTLRLGLAAQGFAQPLGCLELGGSRQLFLLHAAAISGRKQQARQQGEDRGPDEISSSRLHTSQGLRPKFYRGPLANPELHRLSRWLRRDALQDCGRYESPVSET